MADHEQVWGVCMMRDEQDVAYHTVCHMAGEGLDGIIVADNGSVDRTWDELHRAKQELARSSRWHESNCRIELVKDTEVGYYQSRKMTGLARRAHEEFGASWIIPFDADEIWYAKDRMADVLRKLDPDPIRGVGVVEAVLYNHFRTSLDRDTPIPFESMVWRQKDPGALPKVAFRWGRDALIEQGNHGVRNIDGKRTKGDLQIRHFPYRSWEHFKQKAVNGAQAYAATDLPASEGAHWRGYGEILERHGEGALKQVYDTYFDFLSPMNEGLVQDPAPFRRWPA